MKQRRSPSFSGSTVQHRARRAQRSRIRFGWACLTAALTVVACTLTTPLDFVGDPKKQPNTPDGGPDFHSGGAHGGAGSFDAELSGSAGVSDSTETSDTAGANGSAGANGVAGANGSAGASGGTGPTIPVCDDSCVGHGICRAEACHCPSGLPACGNSCVQAIQAEGFCGHCGNLCRSDQSCVEGVCRCLQAGRTSCSTGCVDLSSDLGHCGKCENTCSVGQRCIEGACRSSPCDGFCSTPQPFEVADDGFRAEPIGADEGCFAVTDYEPTATESRIVCWEFDGVRTLKVNGKAVPCARDGTKLSRQTDGWYCVQPSAGNWAHAGLLLPTR